MPGRVTGPMLRGTKVYSYTISPVTPLEVTFVRSVVFGSYPSKSFGSCQCGASRSFRFPSPLTVSR